MKSYLTAATNKLIFGILFLFVAAAANAQSNAQPNVTEAAAVKFLGTQDDMVLFNVSYPNAAGAKFSLIVKDQDGTALYQGSFSEKSFYKQFRLPKMDRNRITFVLRNNRDADIVKSFEINVNSHFVADIDVKKVN